MKDIEQKQLLDELLSYGMITTKQWLLSKGVSCHSADNALKSRKLEILTTGVYARASVPVTWRGWFVRCKRWLRNLPMCVGLARLSYSVLGITCIHLYSKTKRPLWLDRLKLPVAFIWHGIKALWSPENLDMKNYVVEHEWHEDLPPARLSCLEKACLEMLISVPKSISFDHADQLML